MKNNDDRLVSLDVARGFDMLWITGLSKLVIVVCAAFGFGAETALAAQMLHPEWEGLHFIDFVFSTFIFIAGISFPYSLAKQRARGVPASRTILKIWKRAAVLVALGLVYNAILYKGPADTVWGSVLGRIGLSWAAAATVAVLMPSVRLRLYLSAVILAGYWALCLFVGAPDNPAAGNLTMEGCFAGWVDRVLLPGRLTHPGVISAQGILSTLPAVVTAMLGIFTGEYVRGNAASGERKSAMMIFVAAALALAGLFVAYGFGEYSFPIIKKLWSTSYVLVSAGYSLALFAVCYFLIDVKGWWRNPVFFRVIGLNAITIYLVQTIVGVRQTKEILFKWVSTFFPAGWDAVVLQLGYIAICWAFLYFLHKRKIYLKV